MRLTFAREILTAAFLIFQSWNAFPSTAVFIVTKSGIVAATDGKSFSYTEQRAGIIQKLVLLHERVLVAEIGLADIQASKKAIREVVKSGRDVPQWVKDFVPFHFPDWMRGIEKRTSHDISMAILARTVKDEADRTFGTAAPVLKEMAMNHRPPFEDEKRLVAVFVLAGFEENYIPTIYSVTIELNRNDLSVMPGKIEHVHPEPGTKVDDKFYMPAGSAQKAIGNIVGHPETGEYKSMPAQAQIELAQLHKAEALTTAQAQDLLTALVSQEIVASGNDVGWPIWFGSIPKYGRPLLVQSRKPAKNIKK
jgi:hypothetical protein